MREGYKMTELGEIPEEWGILSLSNFTDEITDYVAAGSFESLRTNVKVYNEKNYAIYVRLTDLRKGLACAQKFVDQESYQFLKKSNLYGKEILIANIGANVGEVFMMPCLGEKATIAPNMIIIRANNASIDPNYLFNYLDSEIGKIQIRKIISGSGHPKLNKTELRQLSAILPPLVEQQKIASILSTVDEKIDNIDAQISQTQELKKGLMQQLLTKGIGHTKFKSSELGDIPESWEVFTFNNVSDNITTKYKSSSGKCIELEHIQQGTGRLLGFDDISEKASQKNHFKMEDILFGKLRPYLKKFWFSEFEGGCTSELMVFRAKKNATPKYLYYVIQLNSFIENSVSKSFGTKMPRTSWTIVSEYALPLPPLPEQQKIAAILSTVDEKITSIETKKQTYQQLKKGLMQQLLTGKIRVQTSQTEPSLA